MILGCTALQEIKHYQRSPGFLIPAAPFQRVVREIAQGLERNQDFRWQASAIKALQEATEAYLAAFFESKSTASVTMERY